MAKQLYRHTNTRPTVAVFAESTIYIFVSMLYRSAFESINPFQHNPLFN
jgi:hypothetical protein